MKGVSDETKSRTQTNEKLKTGSERKRDESKELVSRRKRKGKGK